MAAVWDAQYEMLTVIMIRAKSKQLKQMKEKCVVSPLGGFKLGNLLLTYKNRNKDEPESFE